MKRILCAILTLFLLVSLLVACGNAEQSDRPAVESSAQAAAAADMPKTSKGTPINDDFDETVRMQSTPGSTCFSAIGYNNGTLVVTFRESGASYAYYDVPPSVWDDLCSADSMGGFYNSDIKGQYYCEKLG